MIEHKDSTGRTTINFDSIESDMYSSITSAVVSRFRLEVVTKKVTGLNEIFQSFKLDNEIVSLEWDNWSGYAVSAKSKSAEPLGRKIAGYISSTFTSY